jgi:spermidine synthase/predicted MFS family arabinose efflux permease
MESNLNTTEVLRTSPGRQATAVESGVLLHTWLWQPNLIVFVSSACIMILELVAGRIVAPYVGVSLYTWTSIIGVVLAGISLGNYLGGRLADRWASLRFLGGIFLLAGLSCFGILTIDRLDQLIPNEAIIVNILALTTVLFFLPCVILGTVSPVVAKLAVRDLAKTGSTVGKIYAAGAVGSIVGTFATGFILISQFGTYPIVWGVAVLLLAIGSLFVLGKRWKVMLVIVLIIGGGTTFAFSQEWLQSVCIRETNYFCIKVYDQVEDDETVRVLILDRLVHSYTSLDNPTKLVYGYEQMYAEVTAYQAQRNEQLRALFIGGGGYTFPRYMETVYPNSEIHVVEIDPGVTQVAHDLLGLRVDTDIVTYNQDARLFLAQTPTRHYNLIMGDAFNDFSVPYHLTTKEFNDRVRAWLTDDGLYVVNIIDGVRGDFLRAYTYTLAQTFDQVYLAPTIDTWREVARTTFVVIATDTPLDLASFETIDAGDGIPLFARQRLTETELEAVLAEGNVVMLTDQYAPVDQMLAPVVRGESWE